ncbi:glycoside hydrolase family 3 N-terminal domain-containing protein [Lutimonas halocynthiae]|uniref:glycoside hydrolase family 3 protein n=1 Tax=Lutimonas halocynthiae TaxID=1446477 RepID=UPI0025B51F9E|nr:glycoside hydrolase family 3 N-terminal domain-containing protein [Lutimonas halocynthiae]MDN3642480.1 glycoside hydrolase family 3 N-terminal domain-containing protein [Lutimonas halocynthiae]
MKKIFKIIGIVLSAVLVLLLLAGFIGYSRTSSKASDNYAKLGKKAIELNIDGHKFRDLNKNGKLDAYEDSRLSVEDRVNDLVSQMSLEEKAGSMFITMIGMTPEGRPIDKPFFTSNSLDIMMATLMPSSSEMLINRKMNSFNIIHAHPANILARYNNNVQLIGEKTRLGIPITIASDPRHGSEHNPGAGLSTPTFSQWPTSLGLSATRDTLLVREFGNIARQEYLATGIRLALHPMADLATEPRWGRSNGTFGEDAELSAMMTKAYVLGFQGDSLGSESVACMTKHFSGGGPQEKGEDAHFPYGKNQVYPGDNFDYHLIPFEKGAFPAKTAQIMPYYGIPIDQTDENVAFAFNKTIITTMLREKYGFDGVICTDWNIVNGTAVGDARAWGVEDLSPLQRTKKVIDAGCDQFGGESSPELIIELVKTGQLTESRIDQSVKRIMRDKFRLGLFDDPYTNEEAANKRAGKETFRELGRIAQAKSTVLLKNDNILPLKKGTKIYAEGLMDNKVLGEFGELVSSPLEADVILKRIKTPYDERDDYFLESYFHQGRLYYSEEEKKEILDLISKKPSIVVANLDRAAILTEISEASGALLVDFGLSDEVLNQVLFGLRSPEGKLPFELPSSWEAVENQKEDVPYDSKDPLYEFGYGLTYQLEIVGMN